MKLIPIILLLAVVTAPGALRAQTAASEPAPDPADTLRAVDMAAVDALPSPADRAEVARALAALYPQSLKASGVSGTVRVRLVVDARGRALAPRVAEPSGHAALDSAALRVAEGMRFVPARRGGEPQPVWVELPLTFAPPADGAAAAGPAAPRARAASAPPPVDPADTLKAVDISAVEKRPSFADRAEVARVVEASYPAGLRTTRVAGTVVVRMVVDAHGRTLAPRVAEPSGNRQLDRAGLEAVRWMRFVPAERGGAPHPVWVDLPIAFVPPRAGVMDAVPGASPEQVRAWADSTGALGPSEVEEHAVVRDLMETLRIEWDVYPPALRAAGIGGTTTVWFVVRPSGESAAARVAKSAGNAELDQAALRAVGRMRFEPARRDGQAVPAWASIPVTFYPPGAPRTPPTPDSLGAYDMFEVDDFPELQNRAAVRRERNRAYPPALRGERMAGSVMVRFLVGVDGVPSNVRVGEISHPAFAAPAVRVVEKMRFRPGRLNGRAVPVWLTIPVSFPLPRAEDR